MADAKNKQAKPQSQQLNNEERLALLNQKAEELSIQEAQDLAVDFDKAYDEWETKVQPIKVKFMGKVYEISRYMPVRFALFYTRHCLVKDKDPQTGEMRLMFQIPDEKLIEYLELALGREFTEDLTSSQADMGFIMQRIIPLVNQAWGIAVQITDESGAGDASGEAKNAKTPGS